MSSNISLQVSNHQCFTIGLAKIIGYELRLSNFESENGARNLVNTILNYITAEKKEISDGETFGYGIWLLKFHLLNDYLEILELDQDLKNWQKGAKNAIKHIEDQKKICFKNNAVPYYPLLDQIVAINDGVLEGKRIGGIRYQAPEHMSGWYITTYEYNGDINTMKVIKLYELVPIRKEIIKFLALPPGYFFESVNDDFVVGYDQKIAEEAQ